MAAPVAQVGWKWSACARRPLYLACGQAQAVARLARSAAWTPAAHAWLATAALEMRWLPLVLVAHLSPQALPQTLLCSLIHRAAPRSAGSPLLLTACPLLVFINPQGCSEIRWLFFSPRCVFTRFLQFTILTSHIVPPIASQGCSEIWWLPVGPHPLIRSSAPSVYQLAGLLRNSVAGH